MEIRCLSHPEISDYPLKIYCDFIAALSTDCPIGVQATADVGVDYDVDVVTFQSTDTSADVEITIYDDSEEEFREFFCLTITDNGGTIYYTKIYIQGNECK